MVAHTRLFFVQCDCIILEQIEIHPNPDTYFEEVFFSTMSLPIVQLNELVFQVH